MGLVDNGCLCGSHSHLPLGWLIWGMHLCCFLMGWGHSSFSIIYVGRGATSDEHFSFIFRKKHSFRGPGFGYKFGSRFGPPGSKTRAVFGTRTWTQKIHGFRVPLLTTSCEGIVMWLRAQPPFRTALLWCIGSPQDGSIICIKYHRSKLGYVRLASRWCDLWRIFQQFHHKPKPIQKWIKMHSFVPRSMWNGPQNKPQGRQCVTHRRPQNLCLKRVPKTVPMKAQNVETVPDKLPNFHCHFIRRLTDISERALKTLPKNPWSRFETLKSTPRTLPKHPSSMPESFLKRFWNISETCLKHVWNISEASLEHRWNIF